MELTGLGGPDSRLTEAQVRQVAAAAANGIDPAGRRVLLIVPDHTRTCPLGQVVRELHAALAGRARSVDLLVALGTHPPLNDGQIGRASCRERVFAVV